MNLVLCFRRDQFIEELENEELNHELCALAVDDMFESWSPETQEQVLAEWNDWQHNPKSVYVCDQCGKEFTRSHDLLAWAWVRFAVTELPGLNLSLHGTLCPSTGLLSRNKCL